MSIKHVKQEKGILLYFTKVRADLRDTAVSFPDHHNKVNIAIKSITQIFWFPSAFKSYAGTSLVVQWLRICLPTQGTHVRALVREDPTCHRATKPVSHNYWARVLQLLKPARLEPMLTTREATAMGSPCTAMKSSPCSTQLEKARAQPRRPNSAKNKKY